MPDRSCKLRLPTVLNESKHIPVGTSTQNYSVLLLEPDRNTRSLLYGD